MIASGIAKRYGRALFELATETGKVEAISQQLRTIADAIDQNAELRQLLDSPQYLPETKRNVLSALGAKIGADQILINTLSLLADRRRLRNLRAIAEAFQEMAEDAAGRLRAEVISATALPDAYYRQLERTLSEVTGRKVTLVRREDPSLIGGVVTRVGDTVLDGSIKNRLNDIRHQMLVAASPQGRA